MRVLHVDTGHEMRGGQWQVFYLLEELKRRGVDGLLLCPRASPLYQAVQAAGFAVRPLRWFDVARLGSKFDLVHAHDARAHTLALFAPRPLVVSRRVAFPVKRGPLSRWKYRRAAMYLCVSSYVSGTLLDAGVSTEKIEVVYDGVPLIQELASGGRSLVVGLNAKCKSILENASRLARTPIHFSIDLTTDLSRARLFVYISELEGLGSAALLAMAAGVPVIASRTGGLPEAVADGESGLLTDNDPEAIAAAMKTILNDPALARRMAECGRARVRDRFTIERMGTETLAAYERLLA
jgi:glycosyl transferase family 1/glycosyl transferase family 4